VFPSGLVMIMYVQTAPLDVASCGWLMQVISGYRGVNYSPGRIWWVSRCLVFVEIHPANPIQDHSCSGLSQTPADSKDAAALVSLLLGKPGWVSLRDGRHSWM
jgi:hypothetical protein